MANSRTLVYNRETGRVLYRSNQPAKFVFTHLRNLGYALDPVFSHSLAGIDIVSADKPGVATNIDPDIFIHCPELHAEALLVINSSKCWHKIRHRTGLYSFEYTHTRAGHAFARLQIDVRNSRHANLIDGKYICKATSQDFLLDMYRHYDTFVDTFEGYQLEDDIPFI